MATQATNYGRYIIIIVTEKQVAIGMPFLGFIFFSIIILGLVRAKDTQLANVSEGDTVSKWLIVM